MEKTKSAHHLARKSLDFSSACKCFLKPAAISFASIALVCSLPVGHLYADQPRGSNAGLRTFADSWKIKKSIDVSAEFEVADLDFAGLIRDFSGPDYNHQEIDRNRVFAKKDKDRDREDDDRSDRDDDDRSDRDDDDRSDRDDDDGSDRGGDDGGDTGGGAGGDPGGDDGGDTVGSYGVDTGGDDGGDSGG
ncbi:MAG: hypothetical protein ACR2Q4_07965, partial [Geminicoccaceae bacterium]